MRPPPFRDKEEIMPEDPPGLLEGDVNWLLQKLPSGRGILRIARYYESGTSKQVVYDVLDQNENHLKDKHGQLWTIDTEYPPRVAEQPVGTIYRIG
jgi:hypothetical protein